MTTLRPVSIAVASVLLLAMGSPALHSEAPPAAPTPAPAPAKTRPNVLVIVLDDMRDEGVMNVPQVLPKTKQWLQQAGTTFTEGYSTTPLCCPERASIWSGRLSHNHGAFNNDLPPKSG